MPDERLAALADEKYISLTTFRRDGTAVPTPVWFALDGERILVWTTLSQHIPSVYLHLPWQESR